MVADFRQEPGDEAVVGVFPRLVCGEWLVAAILWPDVGPLLVLCMKGSYDGCHRLELEPRCTHTTRGSEYPEGHSESRVRSKVCVAGMVPLNG